MSAPSLSVRRRRKPRVPVAGAVYPHFTLTDGQWGRIERSLGIAPDKVGQARTALQALLGVHRLHERKLQATIQEHANLAAIRKRLRDLKSRVRRLDDFEAVRLLELVEDRYFVRALEGEAGKTGPQTGAHHVLVHYLMAFAERYGGRQPRRKVIGYICKIADPNITPRTIDSAMQYYNSHRGQDARRGERRSHVEQATTAEGIEGSSPARAGQP
jgi:hypothetical protein